MIMWSHEKNIKIKNRIKNSRRKITPWRKHRLAFNASKMHLAGVQRQNRAPFWRWTPETSNILALNASNKHETGVQRQKHVLHGRWTPRMCTTRRLNARMVCKGILHAYLVQGWNSLTPQDLWTPQDHLRICGPHRIPTYYIPTLPPNPILWFPHVTLPNTLHQSPQSLFPITSLTTHIHPLFPINPTYLQKKFKTIFPPIPTLNGRTYTPPSPYIYPSILLHFHTTQPPLLHLGQPYISPSLPYSLLLLLLFFLLLLEGEQSFKFGVVKA